MILEAPEHPRERRAGRLFNARNKTLAFHDFEILECHGARDGVARERVAVVEVIVLGHQGVDDVVTDEYARQRHISRGRSLGEGDEVGANAVIFRGKPGA